MKMAKASEADLNMALKLCSALEAPVAQGLPDEEADAIYRQWAHDDDMKSVRALVRVVERNRAAAWGVKLEGGNHE